jgi:hypothetical protein
MKDDAVVEMRYNSVKLHIASAYKVFVAHKSDESFEDVINAIMTVRNMYESGCFSEEKSDVLKKQCIKTLKELEHRHPSFYNL